MTKAHLPLSKSVLTAALVGLLGLGLGIAPVHADNLDRQKDKIDQQVHDSEAELEDLNSQLQVTGKKLQGFQDQLPGAQQALADAEAAVTAATGEVAVLQGRLSAAQRSESKLQGEREDDTALAAENKRLVGQLASQAYRQGGLNNDLTLFLAAPKTSDDFVGSMTMASRAMTAQNQALIELRARQAENQNRAARLAAVEQSIAELKGQADAALAKQKTARSAAQSAKEAVDSLISQTQAVQGQLEKEKTAGQAALEQQKRDQAEVNEAIKQRQIQLKKEAEARAKKAAEEAKKAAAAAAAAEKKRAANAAALRAKAKQAQAVASSATDDATPSKAPLNQSSWGLIVPSTGGRITSRYGWRPTPAGTIDYLGTGGYVHGGQDWGYGGQCGAPIKAAADGRVAWAGPKSTHGIIVSLDHKVRKGHALTTNYNHMSKVAVRVGQKVKQGQTIGYVGTTGNSTGCHLHFETVVDGRTVDPAPLLP